MDILNIPGRHPSSTLGFIMIDLVGGFFIASLVGIVSSTLENKKKNIFLKQQNDEQHGMDNYDMMYKNGITPVDLLFTNIWSALVAGITEELTFRFLLMYVIFIRQFKLHPSTAIVSSALIFGLTHFVNIKTGQTVFDTTAQAINAFLGGILDGYIYYRTGKLIIPIISHILYDTIILVAGTKDYKKFYDEKKKHGKSIQLKESYSYFRYSYRLKQTLKKMHYV